MSVGKVIRQHRLLKKWDQKRLAQEVDKTIQVISNWERDISSPSVMDLFHLAIALELSADYLIGLTNHPDRTKSMKELTDLEKTFDQQESIFWGDKKLTKQQQQTIMKIILAVLDDGEATEDENETG